jgi:molybdate transport system substrate-binding protein
MRHILVALLVALGFSGCFDSGDSNKKETKVEEKKELLFYCGITMVKPITEIAKIVEKKHNCKVRISQGGSRDLYKSLSTSKTGDLYLPGSKGYRDKNFKDGFLTDGVYVGFNQAAMVVQKGNPKGIKPDLNELKNQNYSVILCNPDSGSIGKHTKSILTKVDRNLYIDAYSNTASLTTDSRNLNKALKDKEADVVVNWLATSLWEENAPYMDVLRLDPKIAPKKKLVINLLSFSQNKEIAKDFMKIASSKQGQEIFHKYGFLDKEEMGSEAKWYK